MFQTTNQIYRWWDSTPVISPKTPASQQPLGPPRAALGTRCKPPRIGRPRVPSRSGFPQGRRSPGPGRGTTWDAAMEGPGGAPQFCAGCRTDIV